MAVILTLRRKTKLLSTYKSQTRLKHMRLCGRGSTGGGTPAYNRYAPYLCMSVCLRKTTQNRLDPCSLPAGSGDPTPIYLKLFLRVLPVYFIFPNSMIQHCSVLLSGYSSSVCRSQLGRRVAQLSTAPHRTPPQG